MIILTALCCFTLFIYPDIDYMYLRHRHKQTTVTDYSGSKATTESSLSA